jgi:hypothetical protein
MEFIQETDDKLESNSFVANLLQRTAIQDGSIDNIIDKANCLSINFPITVSANTNQVIINSIDDLYIIESIFDIEDEDIDLLEINFPITVKNANFSESLINNLTELLDLSNTCNEENEIDEDIECLDFEYPITGSVFNTNNELIDTIALSDDMSLFNFIGNIDDADIITLNFPITATLFDGTILTTNTLNELESTINTYISSCDEDDDYDYSDDDCDNCTTENLIEALVNCDNWEVKDLERDNINYDDFYNNYNFNFLINNTVVSVWNSNTYYGTWTVTGSGNNITVIIDIPLLPLCNNNWILHEIQDYDGETKVDLRVQGIDKLRYVKNCDDDGSGNSLQDILATGIWFVASYTEDADNQTANYAGYQINFNFSGSVLANNESNTNYGSWEVLNSDTQMMLDFGTDAPFLEFNDDDWNVLSISSTQVIIQDISGGGGGTDTLTLQKL